MSPLVGLELAGYFLLHFDTTDGALRGINFTGNSFVV